MREIALGKLARAPQQLGQRCAQTSQQKHDERERGENGERGVNLADALEPAKELRCVGVDAEHLGGLVGDANLNELVKLLIDAAFEEIDQPLPGDIRSAAASQLLDFAELIQRVLVLLLDAIEAIEFGGFGLALLRPDHLELVRGKLLKLGEVRFDD